MKIRSGLIMVVGSVLFTGGCSKEETSNQVSSSPLDRMNIQWVTPVPQNLSAKELVNTVWEADLSKAEGKNQSDRMYEYTFQANGKCILNTRPVEESPGGPPSLFQALMKDREGTWKVDGPRISLSMELMGKTVTDTIEIRGKALYYHGQEMSQVQE